MLDDHSPKTSVTQESQKYFLLTFLVVHIAQLLHYFYSQFLLINLRLGLLLTRASQMQLCSSPKQGHFKVIAN